MTSSAHRTCHVIGVLLMEILIRSSVHAASLSEYVAMIERETDGMSRLHQARARKAYAHKAVVGRATVDYGFLEAFLARSHGQKQRAANAKRVLLAVNRCVLEGTERNRRAEFGEMQFCLYQTSRLYVWLKELGLLDANEIERTERVLHACADGVIKYIGERGAMNRVACQGLGTAAVARLFPDAPHAKTWRNYSTLAWNDWWSFRGTIEDNSGYSGFWLWAVLLHAEQFQKMEDMKGPQVEALIDRYYKQCSPLGVIPDYGDSYWAGSWAHWIAVFEWAANMFDRGELRTAADRIFRYAQSHADRKNAQGKMRVKGLVEATRWMRADLRLRPLTLTSTYTQRHDPYGEMHFDKLVLRTGPKPPDAYVLVNLFDGGYHGHADSGAVSAFIADQSVLLHELGYNQRADKYHNTLLVRPVDEDFLSLDEAFQPSRWYTTEVDFKGAFRFGPPPDSQHVTALYFRLDDVDDVNSEFDFDAQLIEGIDAMGKAVPIVDLSSPDECRQWSRGTLAEQAGRKFLRARIEFRNPRKGERAWVSRRFSPPINLEPYERLRVRWRSGDARLDHKWGLELGLDSTAGTFRFPLWRRLTYRKTTDVEVQAFDCVVYGMLVQDVTDCLGRRLLHTRELALWKEPHLLCVYDTIHFKEGGDYAVGPAWHVQRVTASNEKGFLCRDDWQWDDSRKGDPSIRWASTPRPVWIAMLGPPNTKLRRVEKKLTDKRRQVPQSNHLYARWAGHAEKGDTIAFVSVLVPMGASASVPPNDLRVKLSEGFVSVQKDGITCMFGRIPPDVCPTLAEPLRFLFAEGPPDKARYLVGLRRAKSGSDVRIETRQ